MRYWRIEWRKHHAGVIAFALLLISLYFFRVIFLGKVLLPADMLFSYAPWQSISPEGVRLQNPLLSDIIDSHYPLLLFLSRELRQGHLPTWNPYIAGGIPVYHATLQLISYPINWLLVFLPVERALGWHAVIRWMIAFLSMFAYMRQIKTSIYAALIASVTFTFSGFQTVWMEWPQTNVTVLIPLAFLLVDRFIKTRGQWAGIGLSLITAMLITGGFAPIAGYTLYALGFYAAFLLWLKHRNGDSIRSIVANGIRLGVFVGLGILLASSYLWSMADAIRESNYLATRSQDTLLYRHLHFPLQNLITLLIPAYYGNGIFSSYWGVLNYIEITAYIGILPLFLSGMALLTRPRHPYILFFFLMAILTLCVIYGIPPIHELVSALPLFSIGINTRLLALTTFALAVLAGFGFDSALTASRTRPYLIIIMATTIAMLGIVGFTEASWYFFSDQIQAAYQSVEGAFGHPSPQILTFWRSLPNGYLVQWLNLVVFIGWLGISCGLLWLQRHRPLPSKWFGSLALLLVTGDLFLFGIWFNPATDPEQVFPVTSTTQRLMQENKDTPFRILPLEWTLFGNTSTVYGLANVGGHSISHSARYNRYLRAIAPSAWDRRQHGTLILFDRNEFDFGSNLLNLLNVKYLLDVPAGCDPLAGTVAVAQPAFDTPSQQVFGSHSEGQSFYVEDNGVNQICVPFATYRRQNTGDIIFHLEDRATDQEVVRVEENAAILLDNQWHGFKFEPIENSAGKEYFFWIESPSSGPGNAVSVWTSSADVYPTGHQYIDKSSVPQADLAFAVFRSQPASDGRYTRLEASDLTLYQNEQSLPKAFLAPDHIVVQDPDTALEILQSSEFNPREYVILEEAPAGNNTNESAENHQSGYFTPVAEIVSYTPDSVSVETQTTNRAFLLLTDPYHPDWVAFVDGEPAKIFRADYLFRAVEVPPGTHQVTFEFSPHQLKYGIAASTIALLTLILLSVRSKIGNKTYSSNKYALDM